MRIRNKPWAKVELLASPFYVQKNFSIIKMNIHI